ncbi:mothers against decapentaplegic homolog 6 [Periplaneta americana]|uniref:mothers against decapentaplegic homolog 6 n=1 Tax=Periplaneta americana TaxID=6978 RepID=UPI0037E75C02
MFMFRTKRNTLAKRLWKARVVKREHEASGETETFSSSSSTSYCCCCCSNRHTNSCSQQQQCYSAEMVRSDLLKRLKESQLELLLAAVESRGADLSACVLLPRDQPPLLDPRLLCCQLWRWPDLRQAAELKRLPVCRSSKDPVYICCNPYHWSRLCKPESPPPPYCRFARERLKPEDRAPSEGQCPAIQYHGSLTTNGEGEGGEREWCKLAYWELATRVGRLFSVELPAVNVFTSLPHGDGLCLSTLAQHTYSPPHESVRRTRAKIGLGVTLSQEGDGVWAYNRSDSPIFVNSPTLDDPESRTLLVYRVPPGHCLNIFNADKAACARHWDIAGTGPVDPNSVRISFAKGWGPKYSRQEVTACPCWLEVLLAPCR